MATIVTTSRHETIEILYSLWAGTLMHGSGDSGTMPRYDSGHSLSGGYEGTGTTLHRATKQLPQGQPKADITQAVQSPNRPEGTASTLGSRTITPLPRAVEDELVRLLALPVGWDGAGIAAVTEFTSERARYVLQLAFFYGKGRLPEPFFSPAHDGRMILEWQTENDKELIVDVPQSDKAPIRFLLLEPTPSGGELAIESEMSDEWSIQAIVSRLLDNQPTVNS